MAPFVASTSNFLSFLVVVLDIFAVCYFFILITPLRKHGWTRDLAEFFGERAVFLSFLVALAGVLGSLFYSEIAGFQPCLLCWWQRIFLYPQAILLLIAFIKKDRLVRIHSIVLSSIGTLLALYHTFIQFGGESILPCASSGVSCEHIYFVNYGYVTIPTMSLTLFVLILLFMFSPNPNPDDREVNNL
jgi:disulfide bond formation protein DsbB